MDFEDDLFLNLDWDPVYLVYLFREDFDDIDYLWNFEIVSDFELLKMSEISDCVQEKYSPCVEDISLDDNVLCDAVDRIESE